MGAEPGVVRFSEWELDLSSRELRRAGSDGAVRLAEKPFSVLEALAARPGEVVTRRELVAKLWPDGTTVDFDNNLNTAVAALRDALEDSARAPQVIETIPRRGYRLIHRPRLPRPVRWQRAAAVATATMVIVVWVVASVNKDQPRAIHEDAQKAFLRAVYHAGSAAPESLDRALAAYREAATLDPSYAEAHAGAADVLTHLAFEHSRNMRHRLEQARTEAERALALDERMAKAHRALGLVALHIDWDFEAARRALHRALELAPEDAEVHLAVATYHGVLSQHDEAIAAARRARELDPASFLLLADVGFFYLAAERYEEAIAASRESLAVEPGFAPALRVIVTAASRLGRNEESAEAALRLFELSGEPTAALSKLRPSEIVRRFHEWDLKRVESLGDKATPLARALRHAAVSHHERALELLEESFRKRDGYLIFLTGFAELEELRSDPRFRAIVERMGLAVNDVTV